MVKKAPSILYTPEQAARLDRSQLASLGSSALAELDIAASAAAAAAGGAASSHASANFFASFEPSLIGNGAAGTLSGPRELLTSAFIIRYYNLTGSDIGARLGHSAGLRRLEHSRGSVCGIEL